MPLMLLVLLGWALIALVIVGVGGAVMAVGKAPPTSRTEAFWVGLAALLVYGNAWHLVFPLDGWFWVLPVVAAVPGWRAVPTPRRVGVVELVLVLFALLAVGSALQPVLSPDAGIYHLQTTRWYAAAAVVPGLGNLNPYAAFNHAFFILPAAFGVGPFKDHGWHLVNGLLVIAALAPPVAALVRMARSAQPVQAADVCVALLGAGLVDLVLLSNAFSGPTADVAAWAMATFLISRALLVRGQQWWVSAFLCAGLISLKITSVPVCVCVVALELLLAPGRPRRALAYAVAFATLSLLPWVAHAIAISGYVVYPVPLLRLPVEWAVPTTRARELSDWAWAFARWPGHSIADVKASGWVENWLRHAWLENRAFLIPFGTTGFALAALLLRRARVAREARVTWGAVFLGLVTWWVLIPDLRFAGPLPWALAGASLGALFEGSARKDLLLVILAPLLVGGVLGPEPVLRQATDFPAPLKSECVPATLASGEAVCEARGRPCYELLCARVPASTVTARRPGSLEEGFRTVAPENRTDVKDSGR